MIISHIAAMAKNRVIGKDGDLPWNIPEDMKYFRETTSGHIIIMGRKTFETFPKPLPNRLHVVVTRQKDYVAPEGIQVFQDIPSALEFCEGQTAEWGEEVFIIGGGEIYKQTLDLASTLYLTEIEQDFEGDAKYPKITKDFHLAKRDKRKDPIDYAFCLYSRK